MEESHPPGKVRELTHDAFTIGGGEDADLELSDPGITSTRAVIVRGIKEYSVWNVSPSLDAVRVDGEEVGESARLQHGCTLEVGGRRHADSGGTAT